MHIHMPDELLNTLELVAARHDMPKATIIRRGIKLALDQLEGPLGKAANDATASTPTLEPVSEPAPEPAPAPVPEPAPPKPRPVLKLADAAVYDAEPESFKTPPLKQGGKTWFPLNEVLETLAVEADQLWAKIDSQDDVLFHSQCRWIDDVGVNHAMSLAANSGGVNRLKVMMSQTV
jgi:hypothetical protein